jgi:hypothetical protein
MYTIYDRGVDGPAIVQNDGSVVSLEDLARRIYESFQTRVMAHEELAAFTSAALSTRETVQEPVVDDSHHAVDYSHDEEHYTCAPLHLSGLSDETTICPIEMLPPDMLEHLLTRCNFDSKASALEVSKIFHQIAERILVNEVSEFVKKDKRFADHSFQTISDLSIVKSLKLNFADISEIPASIALLQNLSSLELIENDIQTLPDSMAKLPKLAYLNLDRNKISIVPKVLEKMAHTEVHLHGNNLTSLEAKKCRYLHKVRL